MKKYFVVFPTKNDAAANRAKSETSAQELKQRGVALRVGKSHEVGDKTCIHCKLTDGRVTVASMFAYFLRTTVYTRETCITAK